MGRTAFHASFLLAVPFLKNEQKAKKKAAKREPKKKKLKPDKVENEEEIKEIVVEEEKPFNGKMEVGKPTVFIHVEYTIIPDILIYDFDIVCYGDVAKIYTRDSNTSVKTTVKDTVAWIAFTIDHTIHMSDELLMQLHSTTVAFNVWNDKKKQFKTTQADKPKRFTMFDEDIDKAKAGRLNTMFVPLKECDNSGNIINTSTYVHLPSLSVLVNNSLRAIPYPCHCRLIEALVKQYSDSLQIIKREPGEKNKNKKGMVQDTELSDESESGGKSNKGKKNKKGKKSPLAGSEQLTMLGEVFFANITDTKTEKKFETLTIPYMAVIFTVVDLFNEDQLTYFNPAVVQIRDVNNIPVKLFQKYGFEEMFMTYTLPNDKEYVTARKRVDKVVTFNDVRVMLTHELDATHVMEFILTKFLLIKLWGVRDERRCEPEIPHELFRLTDSNRCMLSRLLPDPFSHPHSKTDSEAVRFARDKISTTVCLAEMEMDISALALNQLLVESSNNFRGPRAVLEYGATSGSWAYYNLPDVHEPARVETVNTSPFSDFVLQKTTVDVAFKTLAPLTPIMMGVFASKEHYNRIVVVIKGSLEGQLCTDIIEEIYKTNKPYVRVMKPPNDLFYARKEFLRPHVGEYSGKIAEELQGKQHFYLSRRGMFHTPVYGRSALTGFILDNGDRVLIVLEGRAHSSLLKFYCFLEGLDFSSGFTVHYNSETAFKTRLYHDFLEMGGIMVITMDEPIEVKQMRKQFLLSRSTGAPSRAVRTINKLNNLFSVKDIATACRQDFFPSAMHLVSFAAEFGVPFRLVDDYTEAPTPPEESQSQATSKQRESNEENLISLPALKESAKTLPLRTESSTGSTGFDHRELHINVDKSGRAYKGGFTLLQACSSTNASMMSTATVISEIAIPAVNALGGVYTPGPTADSSDVRRRSSVKDEESTGKQPDRDTGKTLSTSMHGNKDTKQTAGTRSMEAKSRNKKGADFKPKGSPVAAKFDHRPLTVAKVAEQPTNPVTTTTQPEEHNILDKFPSLLLPRKRLQGAYSNYSSASGATFTNLRSQQEPRQPPETQCPLQEKYFSDFISSTFVTPKNKLKAKAKEIQSPSKYSERPKERARESTVHTSKTRKSQAKALLCEQVKESSVDRLFPPEESVGQLDYPSVRRHRSKSRASRAVQHKKPATPPEPLCPLQEYFQDYYESKMEVKQNVSAASCNTT